MEKFSIVRVALTSSCLSGIIYLVVQSQIAAIEVSLVITEALVPNESTREMTAYVVAWSRLADLPKEKTNFKITPSGSSFTRTYKGSFKLPQDILDKWIEASPGLQDAEKEKISPNIIKYRIKPFKAMYAAVTIDKNKNLITFLTIWS